MTRPVLALDLAGRTGRAFWAPEMPRPRFGYFDLTVVKGQAEIATLGLRRWMRDWDKLSPLKGGLVIFEAPWQRFGDPNSDDPKKRRRDTDDLIQLLWGLASEAATTALELGAKPINVKHNTMMAHWVGNGNIGSEDGKKASIASAHRLGWMTKDHNAADACGVLNYCVHAERIDVPWDCRPCPGPLYTQLKGSGRVVSEI